MTCSDPTDFETLVAYWLREIPAEREAVLEEHLFSCAHCTRRLEELAALASAVRAAVQDGRVSMVVRESFVEAMRQAGLRLREYRVAPGGSVNCTIRADDDAVISRLRAPLEGVQRLDFARKRDDGPEVRIADVPFDAATGEVFVIPSAAMLKTLPAFKMRMRLIAVSEAGDKQIGEYMFDHSPS